MTRNNPELAQDASEVDAPSPMTSRELVWPVVRFVLGLLIILLVVGSLAHWARPQCEGIARGFVDAYGLWGMALGTFLADGFHFPIPPQFYMLLSIASGTPAIQCIATIAVASVAAGVVGYASARFVSRSAWVAARTERSRRLLTRAVKRFGLRAAVLASLLPIPYSVLCYLSGLNRMPRAFLILLCLCRVPKLGLFYLLVLWGWRNG